MCDGSEALKPQLTTIWVMQRRLTKRKRVGDRLAVEVDSNFLPNP